MSRPYEREQTLEMLLESLIKMLGKSNQRVDDLSKRVNQLENFLKESIMKELQPKRVYTFVTSNSKPQLRVSKKLS